MSYPIPHLRASLAALVLATASTAQAQAPQIVTDLPVTHALTALVTQGVSDPVLLLDQGADAHDFALRPSQARAVAGAGLVVWMGPAMTPWMDRAVASLAPSAHLELLGVAGLHLQPYQAQTLFGANTSDDHDEDHDDHGNGDHGHGDHGQGDHGQGDHGNDDDGHGDHGHGDHGHDDHGQGDHGNDDDGHGDHGHGDHGHDHAHGDGTDPHAWLDIDNALIWLAAIADRLALIDPANAPAYSTNAETARTRLQALDAELRTRLAPVGNAGLIVHHDAYGYLSHAYDVNILGSIALGDAAAPGAARLSTIRTALADAGAVCIFPEVNHSDAHVRLIAQGTDLRIGAPLDPEGVSLPPGPQLYETLMRNLATAIADCAVQP